MTDFKQFRTTLERHPEAAIELSDDTRMRYKRGQVPQILRWLIRHPALIQALADDACAHIHTEQLTDQPA